eukprot:gene9254-11369_t
MGFESETLMLVVQLLSVAENISGVATGLWPVVRTHRQNLSHLRLGAPPSGRRGKAIAVLQLVTYVLFLLLPPEAKAAYQGFLNLDGEALLRGEVWRLVTYIFIPKSEYAFVVVVGAMFLMWMGRALDEAWGAFRVNVYVLGGLIPQAIAGLMWPGDVSSIWLYSTTLFAM